MSAVVIIVGTRLEGSCAAGAMSSWLHVLRCPLPAPRRGSWSAPTRSRTACRNSRCPTGSDWASTPLRGRCRSGAPPMPLSKVLRQPSPCSAMSAPSGSAPTRAASPAPWHLPKVWPPAVRATVSSSFMAMRAKVSRMSRPDASGIGLSVRAFRIDVDQAHLHGGERVLEHALARIAAPGLSPVRAILPRCPSRCPPRAPRCRRGRRAKPKVLKPIDSIAHISGQDHQVGPGDRRAVFLLDRPEQATRLVEVDVVRPAVERREALRARGCAAAAVTACDRCRRCARPCG